MGRKSSIPGDEISKRLYKALQEKQLYMVDDITVTEWIPNPPAGVGGSAAPAPTQVHVIVGIDGGGMLVLRLKSYRAVQDLIDALEQHKRGVFPEASKAHDAGLDTDADGDE